MKDFKWDVFVAHASEDKEEIARPLAEALRRRGLSVWYDEHSLMPGDSLRRSIERGISSSERGIVIISRSFFEKEWPQRELDGLVALEQAGRQILIPVWHGLQARDVQRFSPLLADRVALSSACGLDVLVEQILGLFGDRDYINSQFPCVSVVNVSVENSPSYLKVDCDQPAYDCDLSPDGRLLLVGCASYAFLWDLSNRERVGSYELSDRNELDPEDEDYLEEAKEEQGQYDDDEELMSSRCECVAILDNLLVRTVSRSHCRTWLARDSELIHDVCFAGSWFKKSLSIKLSPDASALAYTLAAPPIGAFGGDGGSTAHVISASAGVKYVSISADTAWTLLSGEDLDVIDVAVSHDNKYVAISTQKATEIWTLQGSRTTKMPVGKNAWAEYGYDLQFGPGDKLLAAVHDRRVKLWDIDQKSQVYETSMDVVGPYTLIRDSYLDLAFTTEDRIVVSSLAGAETLKLSVAEDPRTCTALKQAGRYLLACYNSGTVQIWNVL